jgi:hypothetical protein
VAGSPVPLVKQLPAAVVPVAAAAAPVYSQDPEYEDYNAEEQYKVSHIFPSRSGQVHVKCFFSNSYSAHLFFFSELYIIKLNRYCLVNFVFQVHLCKKGY